jgi:hypothetical protein
VVEWWSGEDREKLQITKYNVQNYKPNGIHTTMQPCSHAAMQYHSHSPLSPSFPTSLFFPASLFTPWPPEAHEDGKVENNCLNRDLQDLGITVIF